jgi:hypothetical protein
MWICRPVRPSKSAEAEKDLCSCLKIIYPERIIGVDTSKDAYGMTL